MFFFGIFGLHPRRDAHHKGEGEQAARPTATGLAAVSTRRNAT